MFAVEIYAAVRRFVFVDGNSRREAARIFGLSRETVAKMCRFSLPPGYTRTKPVEKPKLGPLLPVIDSILQATKLLIIDDLGYVPLSVTGAELLFEVFSQRYERGSEPQPY